MATRETGIGDTAYAKAWQELASMRDREMTLDLVWQVIQAQRGLTWSDVNKLLGMPRHSEITRPGHLLDLVRALADAWSPSSVLDPFVVAPAVLGEASQAPSVKRAVGLVPNEHLADLLPTGPSRSIEWLGGRPEDTLAEVEGPFDLVATSPPIGLAPRRDLPGALEPGVYRRDLAYWVMAEAAKKIGDDGQAVFLHSDMFFHAKQAAQLREHLRREGIHLNAAITVAQGLAPMALIRTNLIVFDRKEQDAVFVAHIAPGGEAGPLVRNLLARRPGRVIETGALVAESDYQGWGAFAAQHELRQRLRASRTPLRRLADISTEIVALPPTKVGDQRSARDNAIYVREVRGVVGLEPPAPPKNAASTGKAYEIALDEKLARADYVAWWLNSNTGKIAREAVSSGVTIPRLSLQAVGTLSVPLPPLSKQRSAIGLHERLHALQAEVEAFESELAANPVAAKFLEERLDAYWEHPLEAWVNRLPFPLASILDRYIADSSPEAKVERLLQFFEAFAEFGVAVLLAATRRDESLWKTKLKEIAEPGPRGLHPLEEATFGSWIKLGFKLAKWVRIQLQDAVATDNAADPPAPAGEQARIALFAIADARFAETVCDKRLWGVLEQANDARKDLAHNRAVGVQAKRALLETLERLLAELRETTERTFASTVLVEPGPGEFDGEINLYANARRMTGHNPNFRKRPLASLRHLKARSLYLLEDAEPVSDALELAPLFRMMASPESEKSACFFANGRERGGRFRYISYHFDGSPTDDTRDPALEQLVQELATAIAAPDAP